MYVSPCNLFPFTASCIRVTLTGTDVCDCLDCGISGIHDKSLEQCSWSGAESCFLGHRNDGKLIQFYWVHATDQASCQMLQFVSNYRWSVSASLTSNCTRHTAARGASPQAKHVKAHMTRNHGHKLTCAQLTGANV